MSTNLTVLTLIAALGITSACSSTRYRDAGETETVNVDWGSTDLQTFSEKMATSLMSAQQLNYLERPGKSDDKRIIAYMGGIRNETREHVNTTAVSDAIRTQLLQSGKFRFVVDPHGQGEISEQVRFQQESGKVNPATAIQFGRQLGAEVVVYGSLRDIRKTKGRSLESAGSKLEDVYFQFVLNAANVETGEIIWSDLGEIRKTQRTGLFGAR